MTHTAQAELRFAGLVYAGLALAIQHWFGWEGVGGMGLYLTVTCVYHFVKSLKEFPS